MQSRDHLHDLVDHIADEDVPILARFLEFLARPKKAITWDELERKLDEAPEDDEPETEEEAQAVAEARKDLAEGRVVSHEDIRREFGL